MLDALLVSIGEDGGQLIQSLSVWISNFMANLQSLLANMDQDSLVELTGKIPDFIIEASDDTARDLCREEGDVESEDADDDDSVAMSPCSLAQMFASKVKFGGSIEEHAPTPKFKSTTDEVMTVSQLPHEWYDVGNFLLELYRAKKNAVAWVTQKAFGWFGGSGEGEAAFCKISTRYNGCLNIANGRVGEFPQPKLLLTDLSPSPTQKHAGTKWAPNCPPATTS